MTRALLLVGMTLVLISCGDDAVETAEIPTISAACKKGDVTYCGNPASGTSVHENKAVVMIFSGGTMHAGQVGTMACGDEGATALGNHCKFLTDADQWTDEAGAPITEIPSGFYTLQINIDQDKNVNDPDTDFEHFFDVGVDIICTLENVIIPNSADPVGGAAFTCRQLTLI